MLGISENLEKPQNKQFSFLDPDSTIKPESAR